MRLVALKVNSSIGRERPVHHPGQYIADGPEKSDDFDLPDRPSIIIKINKFAGGEQENCSMQARVTKTVGTARFCCALVKSGTAARQPAEKI